MSRTISGCVKPKKKAPMIRSRAVNIVALSIAAAMSSCGSSEVDPGPSSSETNAPCDNELSGSCGAECMRDEDCALGTFCRGTYCSAECTATGAQCDGTCDERGRCDGSLIVTVPVAEKPAGTDTVIDTASGPASGGSNTGGAGTGVKSCGGSRLTAELKPVNMFLSFDRSRSMAQDDKWQQATSALTAFISDPAAADLGVALRFFGDNECNDDNCTAAACREPLVPLGTLMAEAGAADLQETALIEAIQSAQPDYLGTPIHAALAGALDWAEEYQGSHPEQTTVVVLVTDGEPRGCNEDIDDISALASAAFTRSGVRTYAVGLEGSNPDQMDQIARDGHTGQGYLIGSMGDAAAEFAAALSEIRGRSLACEFPVPTPTMGSLVPNEVNVLLGDGNSTAPLDYAASEQDCGAQGGWYFDDPQNPDTIYLCESACERVLSAPDAVLEVLLGCPTGQVSGDIF